MPSRICASVGFGVLSSSALAVRIWPFWQKPHAGTCSSIQACWTGCSCPSFASPSSVVISTFCDLRHRPHARAHGFAADEHRAGAALAKPAAEARTGEIEIVAKDVEQRRRRLDLDRVPLAVDEQVHRSHGCDYTKCSAT